MTDAVEWLRRGGVVAFPTDTVMGMGCRADSAEAVEAVFALKGRDPDRPLILFVDSIEAAQGYTGELAPRVRSVLARCWPGALTAVLPLTAAVPPGIGRAGTVGVRIPAHPVPSSLVSLLGVPLATTSANASGAAPFRNVAEAGDLWGDKVLAIAGESGSVPSTVADFTAWPPRVLRAGAVSEAALLEMARAAGLS